MELILVRHGLPETVIRDDGLPADAPLSPVGRAQAARMAAWLARDEFDRIYASPLRRARETAEPLASAHGHEVVTADGVAEYDRDSGQYIPLEELRRTNRELYREMMRANAFGGDDPQGFQRLVVDTLEEIIREHRGGRAVVVCHGGVINAWTSHILRMPEVFFFNPTYTSINRFMAASSGERSVITLNESAHLRE